VYIDYIVYILYGEDYSFAIGSKPKIFITF